MHQVALWRIFSTHIEINLHSEECERLKSTELRSRTSELTNWPNKRTFPQLTKFPLHLRIRIRWSRRAIFTQTQTNRHTNSTIRQTSENQYIQLEIKFTWWSSRIPQNLKVKICQFKICIKIRKLTEWKQVQCEEIRKKKKFKCSSILLLKTSSMWDRKLRFFPN